ncbi:MAG: acetyl-CoA hydrolase/transferase C-terminal domain-containing protein [Pseudomonadota bacterium]
MMPVRFTPADIVALLPKGARILVAGAGGESLLLAEAVIAAGNALGPVIFTGAFIPGQNHCTYLANPDCRLETFFITPPVKAAPASQIDFFPLCYNDIRQRLSTIRIDAALFMVTPPDALGNCSFGPAVDFIAELWPRIPVRIAHINPLMPRTHGHGGIPFSEITAFVEGEQGFDAPSDTSQDPIANAIAAHIAPYVCDGATLQLGIGKVPGAVMKALTGRRNLRFHSGLIVDEVVDLQDAGALAPGASVLAGIAIGSKRLYDAIGGPAYAFQPVSVTHNEAIIGAIPNFISVNSALEVDLFGQAYSELGPNGFMSGPGGASDYARGVRLSEGGLRIIALPSSAAKGRISRIVLQGAGPVSLGRMDVDLFVTEQGVADMRGKTYPERAHALIQIAPEAHRDALRAGWADYSAQF